MTLSKNLFFGLTFKSLVLQRLEGLLFACHLNQLGWHWWSILIPIAPPPSKLGAFSTEAEFLTSLGSFRNTDISVVQLAHGPYLQELLGQSSGLTCGWLSHLVQKRSLGSALTTYKSHGSTQASFSSDQLSDLLTVSTPAESWHSRYELFSYDLFHDKSCRSDGSWFLDHDHDRHHRSLDGASSKRGCVSTLIIRTMTASTGHRTSLG